jgi:pimeloyl-ACP methyl ester carboxylesterase
MAGHGRAWRALHRLGHWNAGIPNARLRLVDDAGHNAHTEQPRVVLDAVRGFLRGSSPKNTPRPGATPGRS